MKDRLIELWARLTVDKKTKRITYVVILVGVLVAAGLIFGPAKASRNYTTINNMTIIQGVSDEDLAKGIATAMAAGGHQFDFSYSGYQGSLVGTWQLSDETEDGVSFAVAKRWKETFMPNVLLHLTYTPNGSDDWIMVGGTFRF